MRRLLLTLTLALAVGRPSFAAPIYIDNFDSLSSSWVINANIAGWNTLNGSVDYLKGFPGLSCSGGSGGCIDLDGSTGNAADFASSTPLNLLSGNTYTLTYWVSGSQRSSYPSDSMTVSFGGVTNTHTNIAWNAPFTRYTIVVEPLASTSGAILFSHAGGDNVGLILDDVSVDETAVDSTRQLLSITTVPDSGSSLVLISIGLVGLRGWRKRLG